MKRIICTLIIPLLMFTLCSCGAQVGKEKISIVTTIFPLYDWTREIIGENEDTDITLLLNNGVDMHSFEPTADDMVKIAKCDMFIYVGGESDDWVSKALKENKNNDTIIINLFDVLGEAKKAENEAEYDEHIWLSLKNADICCSAISEGLCKIDKSNAQTYKNNLEAYRQKLSELDKEYISSLKSAEKNTLVFGDRFPFRYMTDDYGIDYYAAFEGCSAESEASFKTVVFLANKIDELKLNFIIKIDGSDDRLASTIIENTADKTARILTLDSMQSVTSKRIDGGITYISLCEKNLEVLKAALN